MEIQLRREKEIPGIPGATLPKSRFQVPESDIEELLQRLDVDDGLEDHEATREEEFIPQQQLPKQQG